MQGCISSGGAKAINQRRGKDAGVHRDLCIRQRVCFVFLALGGVKFVSVEVNAVRWARWPVSGSKRISGSAELCVPKFICGSDVI